MSAPTALVIIGGGEHARVVLDAARASGAWRLAGYVDRRPSTETEALGVPYLGDDAAVLASRPDAAFVIGVGGLNPDPRRAIAHRYGQAVTWGTVVHPRAVVSPQARLAPGVVVMAGAVVNPGARVGDHCIVNSGAIIEHDVVMGPFVHAAPAAAVGGGATIGEGVNLGLGCRVRDHVTVGAGAVVAMGAVVVGAVPARAVVMGVPAKVKGQKP